MQNKVSRLTPFQRKIIGDYLEVPLAILISLLDENESTPFFSETDWDILLPELFVDNFEDEHPPIFELLQKLFPKKNLESNKEILVVYLGYIRNFYFLDKSVRREIQTQIGAFPAGAVWQSCMDTWLETKIADLYLIQKTINLNAIIDIRAKPAFEPVELPNFLFAPFRRKVISSELLIKNLYLMTKFSSFQLYDWGVNSEKIAIFLVKNKIIKTEKIFTLAKKHLAVTQQVLSDPDFCGLDAEQTRDCMQQWQIAPPPPPGSPSPVEAVSAGVSSDENNFSESTIPTASSGQNASAASASIVEDKAPEAPKPKPSVAATQNSTPVTLLDLPMIKAFKAYVSKREKEKTKPSLLGHDFVVKKVLKSAPKLEKTSAAQKMINNVCLVVPKQAYTKQDAIALTTSSLGRLTKEWAHSLQDVLRELFICEINDSQAEKRKPAFNFVPGSPAIQASPQMLKDTPEIKNICAKYHDLGLVLDQIFILPVKPAPRLVV